MSNRKPATFVETRQLWIADEVKRIREIVGKGGGVNATTGPGNKETTLSDSDLGLIQTSVTTIVKWRGEIYGHTQGVLEAEKEKIRHNSAEHQMAKQMRIQSQKRGRK